MHLHLSETRKEHEECKTRHNGLTPAALFERVGLFDVPVIAAHCVWIEGEDFDILRDKGVTVAHNPSSNMKLGSGFAPVKKMLEAGIRGGHRHRRRRQQQQPQYAGGGHPGFDDRQGHHR